VASYGVGLPAAIAKLYHGWIWSMEWEEYMMGRSFWRKVYYGLFNDLWDKLITAAFAATVIGGIASILSNVPPEKEADLPARISMLTSSLNAAAKTIGAIEEEIKQRQALVDQLSKEADAAEKLKTLNKEQMDAVAQVLRSEIKSEERQNFWTAQFLAFFYAALGAALSEGYRFILRWRARRRLQSVA
jgi:hypothetical protein